MQDARLFRVADGKKSADKKGKKPPDVPEDETPPPPPAPLEVHMSIKWVSSDVTGLREFYRIVLCCCVQVAPLAHGDGLDGEGPGWVGARGAAQGTVAAAQEGKEVNGGLALQWHQNSFIGYFKTLL